ncbi:MAG: glycosyltransferase family 2 protein [Gammaproteobacteria bacterium]|nr:glycosyltransferase family 2 protein [Gammaproteobacteria bacterium]
MLDNITPVLLTYNEENNIGRSLEKLSWAKDVVVVDSYSSDSTKEILSRFANVRLFEKTFDAHANQWNHAIKDTAISTEWILALDADYVLTEESIKELESLVPDSEICGYEADFKYCIFGKSLRGSLYPPVTVLYRVDNAEYMQDGHTQRIRLSGKIGKLQNYFLHDDRKPLFHWLRSQYRYMVLEANIIQNKRLSELKWPDKIRRIYFVAPFLVFVYCLVWKGLILDGKSGLYYSFQRMLAEIILSLIMIEHKLKKSGNLEI